MQILIRYRHGRLNEAVLVPAGTASGSVKFTLQEGQCVPESNDAAEVAVGPPCGEAEWHAFCRKLIELNQAARQGAGPALPEDTPRVSFRVTPPKTSGSALQ